MKILVSGIMTALFCLVANSTSHAVNQYVLFSENFEDGTWDGFTKYPDAQQGIVNTGDGIYGAPTFTPMPEASTGSLKNGKMWPMYWHGGFQDSANFFQIGSYGSSTGLSSRNLLGSVGNFEFQSYISSVADNPGPDAQIFAFVKYFNADFSYYYDWAATFVDLKLDARDSWVTHNIAFTMPNDAAIAQFGFSVAQNNWANGAVNLDNIVVSVPEPSSVTLLGLGLAGLIASRMRRRV